MSVSTVFLILFIVWPFGAMCYFNITEYRQMPPMYMLDDYDFCLEVPKPSTYCLVLGEVVPNATSKLWNQIANFSAVTKRHYRHDYLYFGVCLNPCKELIHGFSSFQKDQLYTGRIKNTELVEFFTDVNKRASDNRVLYDKVINDCINYNFREKYDLQVRTFVQYCDTNDESPGLDPLEIVFIIFIATLLFLFVLSSNYDRQLKNKQPANMQGMDHYKQALQTQQDTMLTAFSLYRNYYRLITPPKNEIARDLRFLEAFRFSSTLLVIFAHVLLLLKSMPVKNTEYIEKIFYQLGSNIFINGSVIIQVFLVMSSFLLCIHYNQRVTTKKPGVAEWATLVFYRYLRLAPSLAFMILINGSILPRLQDGPFWKMITETEYVLCRETWWANLLFINNFTLRKSCLHHTWYLAADFQLYVIMVAVLIIMARFPKARNYILGAGVALSFLSTGLVTYFLKLDAIHQETPDQYRYGFWTNGDTIYKGYTPFYTNFGGFVFGTIAALLYLKYKNENLNLKKAKPNVIVLLALPLPFLLLLSGEIFYRYEFVKPSIWIGIYAGLYRNIWAIMCCGLLLLMSLRVGSIAMRFSSLKIFAPLGKISFQVYLVHTVIIRCLGGCIRQPIYVNNLIVTMYILATMVIATFAGFLLYILFELPLTTLINAIIKGKRKPAKVPKWNQTITIASATKEETTAT